MHTLLPTNIPQITGSTYSTNIVVPGDGFSVTQGTPKTYAKKADSGSEITSYFCGDCGTTLFRSTPSFGDAKIIKVGVMDNAEKAFADAKPAVELFAKDRVSWVGAAEGAEQKQAMS